MVAEVASKRCLRAADLPKENYLGCRGCHEVMPSGGGFVEGRLPWLLRLPRRDTFGQRICLREITLVAEVASKRCLRMANLPKGDYFGRRVASKEPAI